MVCGLGKIFATVLIQSVVLINCANKSNHSTSYILPSNFDHLPPYIRFHPLNKCHQIPNVINKYLYWPEERTTSKMLVENTMKCAGINILSSFERPNKGRMLVRKGYLIGCWDPHQNICKIKPYAKLKTLPEVDWFCDKTKIRNLLQNLDQRLGIKLPWVIPSFNLPKERLHFRWAWERNPNEYWVSKPPMLYFSQGVRVISEWRQIDDSEDVNVQKYIYNPFLFKGKKIELRTMFLITGFNPLRIFHLHQFDRFKQQLFNYTTDKESFKDPCLHIYSECSLDPEAKYNNRVNEDIFDSIQEAGGNVGYMYEQVHSVVITTLLEWENQILDSGYKHRPGNFILMSFDFLIDANFKLWLLETNCRPDLQIFFDFYQNFPEIFNIIGINFPPTLSPNAIDKLRMDFYQLKTHSSTTGHKNPLVYYDYHSCRYKNDWNQNITAIPLDKLTNCEIKLLVILEDELSRTKSSFAKRILPSANMEQYFPIIHRNHVHKYKLLLRWEKEFKDRRSNGRKILNDLFLIYQFMRYKPCICEKNLS